MGGNFSTLKTLLTHPRFAYFGDLLNKLFSQVVFSASPDCVKKLVETPLDNVAQHVKQIKFASSVYGIDISQKQFFTCAGEQARRIALPRLRQGVPDWRNGILEQDIASAYEAYRKLHRGVVLESSDKRCPAVSMLATALKSLVNARSMSVGQLYPDYFLIRDANTMKEAVLLEHLKKRSAYQYMLGDQVLRLTVAVLPRSRVQPIDLNIGCSTSGLEPWDAMPGWNRVDLSETQEMTFETELLGNDLISEKVEQEQRRSCVVSGCSRLGRRLHRVSSSCVLERSSWCGDQDLTDLETTRLRTLDLLWTSFDAMPLSYWLRQIDFCWYPTAGGLMFLTCEVGPWPFVGNQG